MKISDDSEATASTWIGILFPLFLPVLNWISLWRMPAELLVRKRYGKEGSEDQQKLFVRITWQLESTFLLVGFSCT